jgi:hypothetical protein
MFHCFPSPAAGRALAAGALLALGADLAAPAAQAAPSAPTLVAAVLPPSVRARIDGHLDETFWATVDVADRFSQFLPQPNPQADPAYRTEVRIVVEDDALVFGIRAHDPRPREIRAPLMRRDQVQRDQDFVTVLIDTTGERRSAQFVRISPRGVVADGVFIAGRTAQVEGNDGDEDLSPDFEVEAAATIHATGYDVELRVPFAALRLPRVAEGVPAAGWRAMVTRSIPRGSSVLLTSAPVPRDALSFIAALQPLDGVGPVAERLAGATFWSVHPAVTLRAQRTRSPDGGASVPSSREANWGVDLKWRPRADWVVDATLNPDFSQVELDTPQLAGNTRFAISLIEKRPFFLESTDVLDLPINAFYTRAVTDPRAGLRATWRGSKADATALALRDDGGGLLLLPGAFSTDAVAQDRASDVSLLRTRWHGRIGPAPAGDDTGPGRLTVGALLTRRQAISGGGNDVAGLDVLWAPDEAMRWRARWLTSSTRSSALDADRPRLRTGRDGGDLIFVGASRREAGWGLNAEWQRTAPGFRNDNGFVEQAGVDRMMVEWIGRHGELALGPWHAHELETFVWIEQRQALDDALSGIAAQTVTRRVHPGLWWTADRNVEAWVHAIADAERVQPGGRLHAVQGLAAQFGINPSPWFTRLQVEAQVGDRVDVDADRVGAGAVLTIDARWRAAVPRPRWPSEAEARRPPWGLEVRQRWQQGTVDAPSGSRALTDTAWQWLAVLHFDDRDSLRATAQASRTRRQAEPEAGLPAADRQAAVFSLVAQRRLGVGRSLAAGWIRDRQQGANEGTPARDVTREEVFFKWSTAW